MGMTPDELRKAMGAVQPSQRGAYIEDGRHELELVNAQFKRSAQNGTAKESWIFEFKILASTNPTHEIGSTRAYIENPANLGYFERMTSCLLALCGRDPGGAVSPADRELLGNVVVAIQYDEERKRMNFPENFLAGRRVLCEGAQGKSRSGGPVTNKKWMPTAAPAPAAT